MSPAADHSDAVNSVLHEGELWLAGGGDVERLVRAACAALVAGADAPAVVQLAGLSVHADGHDSETEAVIYAAMSELGDPLPSRGSPAALERGAVAMARECLAGRITPRRLASWAHISIGHDGPAHLRQLVTIHDVYDELEYVEETEEGLARQTLAEARSLVDAAEVERVGSDAPRANTDDGEPLGTLTNGVGTSRTLVHNCGGVAGPGPNRSAG